MNLEPLKKDEAIDVISQIILVDDNEYKSYEEMAEDIWKWLINY